MASQSATRASRVMLAALAPLAAPLHRRRCPCLRRSNVLFARLCLVACARRAAEPSTRTRGVDTKTPRKSKLFADSFAHPNFAHPSRTSYVGTLCSTQIHRPQQTQSISSRRSLVSLLLHSFGLCTITSPLKAPPERKPNPRRRHHARTPHTHALQSSFHEWMAPWSYATPQTCERSTPPQKERPHSSASLTVIEPRWRTYDHTRRE